MSERSASRFTLHRLAVIDSTNRYALDAARRGAAEGLVVVADHQTGGRGRLGRAWTAPAGSSLLASVLLRPPLPPARVHLVTMTASLAAADAVQIVAGFAVELKWPNDLMVGARKLAGILAETDISAAGEVRAVVVGVGLNVHWEGFPSELADVATACDRVAGRVVSRDALLDVFLDGVAARLDILDSVVSEYRSRLTTLGRRVRVERAEGSVVGTAADIDATGALRVDTDGGRVVTVTAGEVVHLRSS